MPAFSRWVVTGTLTTNSPLHVGDGNVIDADRRNGVGPRGKQGGARPEIASVSTDYAGRACITASELRGFIRQTLLCHADEAEVLEDYPYLTAEDLRACLAYAAAQANHTVVIAS